ncbi:MAG TPA: hypothetical protein EYP60_03595, partial [bacterium (Candidatus Stahlbacteria)]|nr:hypothetical protein [Candidatus Stahlbacteria bacterium]
MKKQCKGLSIVGLAILLSGTNLFAQGLDTLWTRTYGGIYWDEGKSVQQTQDGGYILVGYTESFGTMCRDVYLIKTDAQGDTLWTKRYGGIGSDKGYSVQQTPDGGYIITGDYDFGCSVQQTSDGEFIIVGTTLSLGAGKDDVWLIRTDANGDTLWTKTYGGFRLDGG